MLDAGVAVAGEDEGARARGILARPEHGERAYWRALARFGHASFGQCRALASSGWVLAESLCSRDAPGHGGGERGGSGRR